MSTRVWHWRFKCPLCMFFTHFFPGPFHYKKKKVLFFVFQAEIVIDKYSNFRMIIFNTIIICTVLKSFKIKKNKKSKPSKNHQNFFYYSWRNSWIMNGRMSRSRCSFLLYFLLRKCICITSFAWWSWKN